MLNYIFEKNGILKQEKINKEFIYNDEYIDKNYKKAPLKEMAYLRLGNLIGTIGKIPKNILDVGYGSGEFLKAAKNIIPKVYGYDIPPAYNIDDQDIKIVDNIFSQRYEVVCFFDSLEHFENIYIIENLNTEYIYISVPWCHYQNTEIDEEWFQNWKHRKPNEHLWHFSLESLKKFMKNVGFEYINHSNVEDTIRKGNNNMENILTALFKRTKE